MVMTTNGAVPGTGDEGLEAMAPLLLTIPQAARVLSIGRTTLYELIGEQQIEVVHIGRCARIPVEAVRAFVDQQRQRR